jgi:uncharacterized protein (TIGR03000 family)
MKNRLSISSTAIWIVAAAIFAYPSSLQAGWGILRGGSSGGGSSGDLAGGASSGGYAAAYGSSGYAAAYGSSGQAVAYGSSGYEAYSSLGGASTGGSSGGAPGLLQRMSSRIHAHWEAKHARHAARRASYGSSGFAASSGGSSGYASSGGYSASYSSYGGGSSGGSSGVSYGSVGHSSGASYGSTGVSYGSAGGAYYGASSDSDYRAAGSLVANSQTRSDAVYLTVAVPGDAKVFVNGNSTTSTGAVRKFVSHGLKTGKEYRFKVRAELEGLDGQLLTEEKTLVVTAGAQEQVQFAFNDSVSPIETAVTLNLPEGAKVILAGTETKATGESRTFRTSRLKPGESWDDYEIEVHYGDEIKRRAVRLIAGDKLQLTFDFSSSPDKLALR